jgi:hypothetical protein
MPGIGYRDGEEGKRNVCKQSACPASDKQRAEGGACARRQFREQWPVSHKRWLALIFVIALSA